MKKYTLNFVLTLILTVIPAVVFSQVSLPKVFGDNMVLQQGKKVNVWGYAAPSEVVTVKFQKQTKKVKADEQGNWSVKLDELTATQKPQTLTVQGKSNKLVLSNILIGEVWLASGQSNMEYSMNRHQKYAKPAKGDPDYLSQQLKEAKSPNIRVLYVEKNLKADTLPSKGWQMINEETLAPVSAIGYFFAKSLVENLDVPVGIISTSWGGTPIETWTPEEAYLSSPALKDSVVDHKFKNITIGDRFQKMVAPMIPYSLKGFLWYQGETNLTNGDMDIYAKKQKSLIESWRSAWKDENLPFYYVQLAPHTYSQRRGDESARTWEALPYFWEVQTSCLSIPHTGMVVTTDLVDNPKDIHPSYKWVVGERLARWALAKDYGKTNVVYSGPAFKDMTVQGNKIILEFDHTGSGLTTSDGKAPDWFYVKEEKGRFAKVDATIEGNKVLLQRSRDTGKPMVRFAWDELAMPNLINKEGLPALPFSCPSPLPVATSGNPISEGWYADPEGIIFDDQYWIFPTYSSLYEKQIFFDAFSSPDLVNWTKHERVLDNSAVKWVKRALWAPAILKKDNRYFLFFGGNDIQNDQQYGGIGVAVADKPQGPYADYLGKPLIDKFHNGAQPIDQFVFKDTDGTYYIYYGGWGHCNIARLKDDFTGFVPLADGSIFKEVTPKGYTEGPFMFVRNGKYYFMWSEGGWGGPDYSVAYAIADSPFGPFERIGKVLQPDPNVANGAGHHSVIHEPKSDKWYMVYHRRPIGITTRDHRVTCIDEMFFDENGYIKPVKLTHTGVTANPIR